MSPGQRQYRVTKANRKGCILEKIKDVPPKTEKESDQMTTKEGECKEHPTPEPQG